MSATHMHEDAGIDSVYEARFEIDEVEPYWMSEEYAIEQNEADDYRHEGDDFDWAAEEYVEDEFGWDRDSEY